MKAMKRKRVLILGHRGFHSVHPENSIAAFRAAFEAGADGIECDLQKDAGGRYVITHDPPTGAALPGPPGLEEMLAALPAGAYLNLELKANTLSPADCPAVHEILRRRPSAGPLLVSSFEPRLLVWFKAHGVPIGLLLGEGAREMGALGVARILLRLRPEYLNLPILMFEMLGRRRARALAMLFRILGFSLAFWTVNTAREMAQARGLARILITDEVASAARET